MYYIITQTHSVAIRADLVEDFYIDEHYDDKGIAVLTTANSETYLLGHYDTKEQAVEVINFLAYIVGKGDHPFPVIVPSVKDADQLTKERPGFNDVIAKQGKDVPSLDDLLKDIFGGNGK